MSRPGGADGEKGERVRLLRCRLLGGREERTVRLSMLRITPGEILNDAALGA
jgi:hypothetical protein